MESDNNEAERTHNDGSNLWNEAQFADRAIYFHIWLNLTGNE